MLYGCSKCHYLSNTWVLASSSVLFRRTQQYTMWGHCFQLFYLSSQVFKLQIFYFTLLPYITCTLLHDWKPMNLESPTLVFSLQNATRHNSGSVLRASRKHTCSQCDRSYTSSYGLRVHEALHSGHYPYWCKICGKGCLSSGNLKRHMTAHTMTYDYQCSFCVHKFCYASSLKRHIQYCHKDAIWVTVWSVS